MINTVFLNHGLSIKQATKRAIQLSLIGLIVMSVQSASAACDGIGCACTPSEIQFASPTMQPTADGRYPISLEADNVEAQGDELVTLTGNAEVSQGRQTIVADSVKYYRNTDRVVATGNVEMISENGDYLSSESIDVAAPSQIGTLTNTEFKLASALTREGGIDTVQIESRGTAGKVNLEGEGILSLEDASYTTCAEGSNAVMLQASKIELDRNAGVGVARNATVKFFGVPLAYTPYISFPINDERKTGLLIPRFGSDKESGGIYEFPWYWNIAKNQDATITPKIYTNRGTQITAEYRHQSARSETLIYGEFLPDDELFGADRDLVTIKHKQKFTDTITGSINYNDVSDSKYFDDLSNDVSRFSDSYVPQNVALSYKGKYLSIAAKSRKLVIVDSLVAEENRPYEKKPQVTFRTKLPTGPLGMKYGLDGSYTDFASDFRVEGTRLALSPYVSMPFKNIWGSIEPKVTVHSRNYSLNNVAAGQDDNPSFTVPVFSLDMKIALEKNSSWLGKPALHTLEPRVFYLYAPEEDQTGVPDFDTSATQLNNFGGIYQANRFSGQDRVGDTNQVTVGFSSEISDAETGDRRFSAQVGQLYRLDDQQQHLQDNTVIESGLGDLLAKFTLEGENAWNASAFFQYSHDDSDLKGVRLAVDYAPKDNARKNVSLDYYLSKNNGNTRDQVTLTAYWPLSDHWSFFGSERYSLEDSESLSTVIGAEYDGCCWKLRAFASEGSRRGGVEDKKQYYFIELELNSIGTVGRDVF